MVEIPKKVLESAKGGWIIGPGMVWKVGGGTQTPQPQPQPTPSEPPKDAFLEAAVPSKTPTEAWSSLVSKPEAAPQQTGEQVVAEQVRRAQYYASTNPQDESKHIIVTREEKRTEDVKRIMSEPKPSVIRDVNAAWADTPPATKAFYGATQIFMPRGAEYFASYLPGSSKSPDVIAKEQIMEFKQANPSRGEWVFRTFAESPFGQVTTSMVMGAGIGFGLGSAMRGLPGVATVVNKGATLAGLTFTSMFVGQEIINVKTGYESGVPQEKIVSRVGQDIFNLAGFAHGFKIGINYRGPWEFWGKEKVPAESITSEKVLEGRQRFPYEGESPAQVQRSFNAPGYKIYMDPTTGKVLPGGWHATAEARTFRMTTEEIGSGTSESPGLSLSYQASVHFTRVSGGYSRPMIGLSGQTIGAEPQIIFVSGDVGRIPASVRTQGFGSMNRWLTQNPGKIVVAPSYEVGKPEIEAKVTPSSFMTRIKGDVGRFGFSKYTEVGGVKIPLKGFGLSTETGMPLKEFSSMVRGISSYSEPYVYTESLIGSMFASRSSSRGVPSSVSIPRSSGIPSSFKPSVSIPKSSVPKSSFYSGSYWPASKSPSFGSPSPSMSMVSPSPSMSPSMPKYPSSFKVTPSTFRFGFSQSFFGKSVSRRTKTKQGRRYRPSLGGILLGLETPRMPKGFQTGMTFRPMVGRRRRR